MWERDNGNPYNFGILIFYVFANELYDFEFNEKQC